MGAPDSVRLEELRLGAEEVLLDARLALGQNEEVVAAAEGAVAQYPLREQFWGHLMKALYRSGRQAEALRRVSAVADRTRGGTRPGAIGEVGRAGTSDRAPRAGAQ